MTDNTSAPIISIEKWARKRRVSVRQAYRWANSNAIPVVHRTVTVLGIPANTPKPRKGKSE